MNPIFKCFTKATKMQSNRTEVNAQVRVLRSVLEEMDLKTQQRETSIQNILSTRGAPSDNEIRTIRRLKVEAEKKLNAVKAKVDLLTSKIHRWERLLYGHERQKTRLRSRSPSRSRSRSRSPTRQRSVSISQKMQRSIDA